MGRPGPKDMTFEINCAHTSVVLSALLVVQFFDPFISLHMWRRSLRDAVELLDRIFFGMYRIVCGVMEGSVRIVFLGSACVFRTSTVVHPTARLLGLSRTLQACSLCLRGLSSQSRQWHRLMRPVHLRQVVELRCMYSGTAQHFSQWLVQYTRYPYFCRYSFYSCIVFCYLGSSDEAESMDRCHCFYARLKLVDDSCMQRMQWMIWLQCKIYKVWTMFE